MLNRLKSFLKKFFAIDDAPNRIAAGAALGIFWGIMPGEGVIMTLLSASLLGLNRAGALAGVLASNMWTTFLVLPPASVLGGFLFGEDSASLTNSFKAAYELGHEAFLARTFFMNIAIPLLVGFLIVSLAISLSFYGALYLLLKYKKVQ